MKYLKEYQWDEAAGKKQGQRLLRRRRATTAKSRPDLSNTAFFLEALKAAGVPTRTTRPSRRRSSSSAAARTSRASTTTSPWAGKINDGSFIYTGANGGENRRTDGAGTKTDLGGYGSMTYAGIKSMIYCGVGKDDPRVKKALEWIGKNYTLDANPGMPEARPARAVLLLPHLGQVPGRPRRRTRSPTPRA